MSETIERQLARAGGSDMPVVGLPGLPVAPEPEPLRVGFVVAHVPSLVSEECVCGRVQNTTDAATIDKARRGEALHANCSCGRLVVIQRRLVSL